MKKFHFTLEALRTVRQQQEQAAMEQYAQALVAREQARQWVEGVRTKLGKTGQEILALLKDGCPASRAAQAQDYHRSLQQHLKEAITGLGQAECRVNMAKNAMLVARQQREIVDKCFDKQKDRHQREQLRGEQKLLDELASRRPASILSWNPGGGLS
jgi:flagellar export protein FliJ